MTYDARVVLTDGRRDNPEVIVYSDDNASSVLFRTTYVEGTNLGLTLWRAGWKVTKGWESTDYGAITTVVPRGEVDV